MLTYLLSNLSAARRGGAVAASSWSISVRRSLLVYVSITTSARRDTSQLYVSFVGLFCRSLLINTGFFCRSFLTCVSNFSAEEHGEWRAENFDMAAIAVSILSGIN